jgi:hypothetical protein
MNHARIVDAPPPLEQFDEVEHNSSMDYLHRRNETDTLMERFTFMHMYFLLGLEKFHQFWTMDLEKASDSVVSGTMEELYRL